MAHRCHDAGTMCCQHFVVIDCVVMMSQLTVSGCGRLGWFKHCHLMEVGVSYVSESSGGHPSNRVGQCQEKNLWWRENRVGARSSHWHDFKIYYWLKWLVLSPDWLDSGAMELLIGCFLLLLDFLSSMELMPWGWSVPNRVYFVWQLWVLLL